MANRLLDMPADWIAPPGATIQEAMEERGWTQKDLADRLGFSSKHVNLLLNGKASVTLDAAVKLERVVGSSARFWLRSEANYRTRLAELQKQEIYKSRKWLDWLNRFPLNDLKKVGVLPSGKGAATPSAKWSGVILAYFGVVSPQAWEKVYGGQASAFQYRRAQPQKADDNAIISWLRFGERAAEKMEAEPYSQRKFEARLKQMRALTTLKAEAAGERLTELCAEAGVKLIFAPPFENTFVSGVVRRVNRNRIMQLSNYDGDGDKFWLTFFHEAAHILLHGGDKQRIYLEDEPRAISQADDARADVEADEWARDFLIPPQHQTELNLLGESQAKIKEFAAKIGLHPGIVVDRLQTDGLLDKRKLNNLKTKYTLKEKPRV